MRFNCCDDSRSFPPMNRTVLLCFLSLFGFTVLSEAATAGVSAASSSLFLRHITRTSDLSASSSAERLLGVNKRETAAFNRTVVASRSALAAFWDRVPNADGYTVEIAMDGSFASVVPGASAVYVGDVVSHVIAGLQSGTTYYIRIQPFQGNAPIGEPSVMSVTTAAGAGLVINPIFDASVTDDPNAPAIEATIMEAVALYEQLLTDPITVTILFRYSSDSPDGTALPRGALAESFFPVYAVGWDVFIAALKTDGKTPNDATANSTLPPAPLSPNIIVSSADGRAIGQDTPAQDFNGAGPYDGIITLNSTVPFDFGRPVAADSFDALEASEHEIDEVLGLGSYLNAGTSDLRPQDLFSWSEPGVRNITTIGSRYFSIDAGTTDIIGFNQDAGGDFGDWLSEDCPQAHPYVQNAFGCPGQSSDIASTSPEGINLDVIGYDVVVPPVVSPEPYGQIIKPTPGTTLSSPTAEFMWDPGTPPAMAFWLIIGDERVPEPGGSNIFSSSQTGGTTFNVTSLPIDGRTLFVRLWSFVGGGWYMPPQDVTYRAAGNNPYSPVISPAGGTFKKAVTVTMTCATPGAAIYFSTDGSTPANLYTGAFKVTRSTTVRAKAVKAGLNDSAVTSALFAIGQKRPKLRHH